jgi:O-acetyl-ADP-ribose deacetylase (regulator of RNase III)
MSYTIVEGDIADQSADAIVNAWNRNIIPWQLLLPQGVSGAIKKAAGLEPFKELQRKGPIPLGGAVVTGPGKLKCKAIIHVAGISMFWRSSEKAIRGCVRSALKLASEQNLNSIAFPLIGSGTGGIKPEDAQRFMTEEFEASGYKGSIVLVLYKRS